MAFAAVLTLLTPRSVPLHDYGPTSPIPACESQEIDCLIHKSWPWEQWQHVHDVIFGPTKRCRVGESNGHPDSIGRNGDSRVVGLLQLDEFSWKRKLTEAGFDWSRWSDPLENLRMGNWIWERSGWRMWQCADRGWT